VVKSEHNPHWDRLAAAGQLDVLAQQLELWRGQFLESLAQWVQQAPVEFADSARPLLDDLNQLQPQQLAQDWENARAQVAGLHQDGHWLRDEYLQNLGPTPLACLNSVLVQLERLAGDPDGFGLVGSALFGELRVFENWAGDNAIQGEHYEATRRWLEDLALGLLARKFPTPQQARQQLSDLWKRLSEEHARQAEELSLSGPTGSRRWNSWILLLETCENEIQEPGPILDTLDSLDADVEEVAAALTGQPEVVELAAEFHEASQQLRQALMQGKKLKGWSQILPPLLVELDAMVPRDTELAPPVSRVRSLCNEFESGQLSTEQFHRQVAQFADSLVEARRQSRIATAQHPSEAHFVEALGKLQGGLDILAGVERSGQASRLEMGCTLIEEGLAQISQLEADHD
jgi:hypothetical protein